jgi:hypothetical protein
VYLLPIDQQLPWHPAAISAAKLAVYEAFRDGVAALGLVPGEAGLVADGESGAAILRDAASRGFITVCARRAHGVSCDALFWKAVVHYNPDGDAALNAEEAARARRLSGHLRRGPGPRLMCDVVVAPTRRQIEGGIRAYERHTLPALTRRAIVELLDAGADPAAWVVEGLERHGDYAAVVDAAAGAGRDAPCFVRAAGHGDGPTRERMSIGLSVPGMGGVVLPRAPFWEPIAEWMCGRTSRAAAVTAAASQFEAWVRHVSPWGRGSGAAVPAPMVARCVQGSFGPSR